MRFFILIKVEVRVLKNELNLICPSCQIKLESVAEGNSCRCGFEVKLIAGVPVLRTVEPDEQLDFYTQEKKLLRGKNSANLAIPRIRNAFERGDLILELGAGIDTCDLPNLVKTDAFVYSPALDYVVDAHSMPFADNTFDFVYSLAVFEHLHSPWIAAKEIYRVLKPGGKVYILTAFMQHLHGYPYHYFNMTTMGLQRIFSDFEIIKCVPSPHCSLLQIGRIMEDLSLMTKVMPEDKKAMDLNFHLSEAFKLIPKIQDKLIEKKENFEFWQRIAPAVELAAVKPK